MLHALTLALVMAFAPPLDAPAHRAAVSTPRLNPSHPTSPLARRRITLDVVRQDIHEVMRVLAEAGKVNIVLDPKIRGTVTLYLRQVWISDVFDAVLATQALTWERVGGIIYVRRHR